MKFNDEEIQEALRKGMKIIADNRQDKQYFLDTKGELKVTYTSTDSILSYNYYYNDLMKMDWQIVKEPEYEYLWVVQYKTLDFRMVTYKYYKTEEDVKKDYFKGALFERCEWSKRRI